MDKRQSCFSDRKKGCACSRIDSQKDEPSAISSPPNTARAARTAEVAPDNLTVNSPSQKQVAETGSGHVLVMDGAPDESRPENGGRNLAPRPMETLLAGAGACTAYDVVLILQRGRHDVRGCRVEVRADRAATDPKVFTRIELRFVVTGRELPEAAVARAVQLSHEKYCSISHSIRKDTPITSELVLEP